MLKCINGHEIEEDYYAFCPTCGVRLEKKPPTVKIPEKKASVSQPSVSPEIRPNELVDHTVNITELLYNVRDGVKLYYLEECRDLVFKKPDSQPDELEMKITSSFVQFYPYKVNWLVSPLPGVTGCRLNDIEMKSGKYYILHCDDMLYLSDSLTLVFMPMPGNEEVMNSNIVAGLKKSIEEFSKGSDERSSTKDIVMQLMRCPMYFAIVDNSLKTKNIKSDELRFLSMRTKDNNTIPMFTSVAEGRKFADCKLKRLSPDVYIDKLINIGLPLCIDPFSENSIALSYDGIVKAVKPQLQKQKTSFKNGDIILGKKLKYTVTETPDSFGFYQVYTAVDDKNTKYRLCCYDKTSNPYTPEQTKIIFDRAKLMHRFNDPCVVRAKELIEDENKLCLLCPMPEGVTLASILKNTRTLPVSAVIEYSIHIAEALQYLHTFTPNFIACDLKPSGIVITPENNVVLTDFDISNLFKQKDAVSGALKRSYAAPEIYFDINMASEASDSYSLGILMYHLLTGVDITVSWQALPPIRSYNAMFSKKLDQVVSKCLSDNPGERYPNCKVLINDLYLCVEKSKKDKKDKSKKRR